MKHYRPLAWMMAIAIAGTVMTACSLDGNEPEKPFTTCPVSESTLYACGIGQPGTRSVTDVEKVLFTDDDIEWFDASTGEQVFTRPGAEQMYQNAYNALLHLWKNEIGEDDTTDGRDECSDISILATAKRLPTR